MEWYEHITCVAFKGNPLFCFHIDWRYIIFIALAVLNYLHYRHFRSKKNIGFGYETFSFKEVKHILSYILLFVVYLIVLLIFA